MEQGPSSDATHDNDSRAIHDVGTARDGVRPKAVRYVTLSNRTEPFLLARVRWPDIHQAISPVRPDWQDDPGLFDLPYSPASTTITFEQASELAAAWGARLPSEEENAAGPQLIRRMPSDWSYLSTAERRAWSIEAGKSDFPVAMPVATELPVAMAGSRSTRRRWGRRRPSMVIDLTDPVRTTAEQKTRRRRPRRGKPVGDGVTVETLVLDLAEPVGGATGDLA